MSLETEASAAAHQFRREHGLGLHPLGDLVTLIEQATRFDVAVVDAGANEHGLTVRDPVRGAVFIAVASTDRPMRQRSSLAHELAHVLFEDWATVDIAAREERSREEIRADAFARHLLLPVEAVREFIGPERRLGSAELSNVVQRFGVSPQVASIVMHEAGYVDTATKKDWMSLTTLQLAVRHGWSDHYRALRHDAQQRRAPQRLLSRAIDGYVAGVVSVQDIATLRGIDAGTVEAELRDAGVAPADVHVTWADPQSLAPAAVDPSDLDEVECEHTSRPDGSSGHGAAACD